MAKLFYVIEVHDLDEPREKRQYVIRSSPGVTNMSGEQKVEGWLGTTNNVWEFAHGQFQTLEKAQAFIQKKMPGATLMEDMDDDEVLEIWGFDDESIWTAEEWLDQATNNDLGLYKSMTDDDIEKVADQLEDDARKEGVHLTTDVIDVLRKRVCSMKADAHV